MHIRNVSRNYKYLLFHIKQSNVKKERLITVAKFDIYCMLYCMLSKRPECTDGWYGVSCSRQCSGHCRDSTTCNHVTGQCEKGCDKGWTGSLCRKGKLFQ